MRQICLQIICLLSMSFDSIAEVDKKRYSAANTITFKNPSVTKDFVGSGFLLSYNEKTYAVTAKHVLLETMDQGISHVYLGEHIEKWHLRPFNEDTGVVELGRLINTNPKEPVGMASLQNDWLLFEVSANYSNLKPLKVADHVPDADDEISVHGCNYSNQDTCQQERLSGKYVKSTEVNLLIKLETQDMGQLRGLSGAPVLNTNDEVIGIVSNVIPDQDRGGVYFAPFTIQPVIEFLKKLDSQS